MPGFQVKDASLEKTAALPNGAAATTTAGVDTMNGTKGDFVALSELCVDVPALTTTQIGDGQTITYTVETDADVAFGSPVVLATLGVQTGAGGVGCAAFTSKYKLPTNVERYVRVKATKAGASNASTASMTAGLRF
jgi:hypothetical protein